MRLRILPGTWAVCRLPADHPVPQWAAAAALWSATRTADELSIVCPAGAVPPGATAYGEWAALGVEGHLDLGAVGILSELTSVLASAGAAVFVISTYDTDYLLVPLERLEAAGHALVAAGHPVEGPEEIAPPPGSDLP